MDSVASVTHMVLTCHSSTHVPWLCVVIGLLAKAGARLGGASSGPAGSGASSTAAIHAVSERAGAALAQGGDALKSKLTSVGQSWLSTASSFLRH